MEKTTEIKPFAPILNYEFVESLDELSPAALEMMKIIKDNDPLFTHAPKVIYQLFSILYRQSFEDSSLYSTVHKIGTICRQRGFFTACSEDLKLKTKESVVLINQEVFYTFDRLFYSGRKFGETDCYDLSYYSSAAIKLLKSYICENQSIHSSEPFTALFELYIIGERLIDHKNLKMCVKNALENKIDSGCTYKDLLALQSIFKVKSAEVTTSWMILYLRAVKSAKKDPELWSHMEEVFSLAIDKTEIDHSLFVDIAKALLEEINTVDRLNSFQSVIVYFFDEELQSSFMKDAACHLCRVQGYSIFSHAEHITLKAESLHLLFDKSFHTRLIQPDIRTITVDINCPEDISQIKCAAAFFPERLQHIETIEWHIQEEEDFNDELRYISKELCKTENRLLFLSRKNEGDLFQLTFDLSRFLSLLEICRENSNIDLKLTPRNLILIKNDESKITWEPLVNFLEKKIINPYVIIKNIKSDDRTTLSDLVKESKKREDSLLGKALGVFWAPQSDHCNLTIRLEKERALNYW